MTSSRNTVTRSDAVTSDAVTAASDLQKRVVEEHADRLRLLILAGGHEPRFAKRPLVLITFTFTPSDCFRAKHRRTAESSDRKIVAVIGG